MTSMPSAAAGRRAGSRRTFALAVVVLAIFGLHHLVAGQLEPGHSGSGATVSTVLGIGSDAIVTAEPSKTSPLGLEHGGLLDDSGAMALCVALILAATVAAFVARHGLGSTLHVLRRATTRLPSPRRSPVLREPLFTTSIIRC